MNEFERLAASRALWNRSALDLESDSQLAQILDRGNVEDWRALYRLAQGIHGDEVHARELRRRILKIITTVPVTLAHFWLAALESLPGMPHLGWPELPAYPGEADV